MTDKKLKELLDNTTNHLKSLNTSKTSALKAISDSEKESLKKINDQELKSLSLLDTRKDANIAAIDTAGDLESIRSKVDVPDGSSVMQEVRNRNMIEPGSLPFLFGILSRQNDYTWGSGHFTSELGINGISIHHILITCLAYLWVAIIMIQVMCHFIGHQA
ncbi:MAG: hypothetical protein KTV77_05570 [Wolbachia endosymbiont of Fragariocoptes setiger]|nr:hypothetical protein [Wolbachia endosymbiont of Fragariocoptes setiger]